jgi:hypothetical protein
MDLLAFPSAPIVQRIMSVRSESGGPYALAFKAYEHAKFVSVLRGHFDLQIEGHAAPSRVREGDCYLLADGRPYRIFNAEVPETEAGAHFSAHRGADGIVRWGREAVDTVVIGSRVTFNSAGMTWLRDRLPPLVHLPAQTAEATGFRKILALLGSEPETALGSAAIADRCVGILLVQTMRYLKITAGFHKLIRATLDKLDKT